MKDLYFITIGIGLSAFVAVALAHKQLVVRPGENITLSCKKISRSPTQVDWFKVENGTKAKCVSSIFEDNYEPSYCNGFKNGRFRMDSNQTLVFLTISETDFSDSGLYFCGFFMRSNIILGETTYLKVTGVADPTYHRDNIEPHSERKLDQFLLVIVLGSLSTVLLTLVIILTAKICKLTKAIKELREEANRTPSEDLNYAALNIKSSKRPAQRTKRTPHRPVESDVIYSCTK